MPRWCSARAQSRVSATPGRLLQVVAVAQLLDQLDDLAAQRLGHLRRPGAQDRHLALEAGVVDPVVEAAPLQRVVQLAGAVRGEHDDRRGRGPHGAELGDRHLVRRQHLEQERLELVVGPVHLVDQQHRRAVLERLQHRPGEQEARVVQALLGLLDVGAAGGLERAQVQDLAREVPVVERLGRVDALVALEPHQRQVEALRDRLGERGLAGAGLTLEQQRPLHPQRQERHRRQRVVGEVAGPVEAGGHGGGRREVHAARLLRGCRRPARLRDRRTRPARRRGSAR